MQEWKKNYPQQHIFDQFTEQQGAIPELLILQELGQVDFRLGLVDGDMISAGHGHHVHISRLLLLGTQGSLANADSDAVVGDGVAILKRLQVEIFLEIVDHLLELPVGVRGVPGPRLLLHHCRSSSSVSGNLGNGIV